MIIYSAATTYQMLCCILHKIEYKSNETAILFITDTRGRQSNLIKGLKGTGFFKDVFLFPNMEFVNKCNSLFKGNKTDSGMLAAIDVMCKMIDNYSPVKLENKHEYYVSPDYNTFGIYLVRNKLQYSFFEDGCGVLSRPEMLMHIIKDSPFSKKVMKLLKLNAQNECVIRKYADFEKQEDGFYDQKAVDFSVSKKLKNLSEPLKNKIMNAFNAPEIKIIDGRKALLLTQPFFDRKFMSYDEQQLIYTLLVDYFCEGYKLYIKPHPADVLSAYSKWFKDSILLDVSLPCELLPFYTGLEFDLVLTVSSTAIYSMSNLAKSAVCFTTFFETSFKSIHRYYSIVKSITKMEIENFDLFFAGADKEQFFELYKKYSGNYMCDMDTNSYILKDLDLPEKRKNAVILIDDFDNFIQTGSFSLNEFLANLNENDVLFFVNSREEYLNFTEDAGILENMLQILISQEKEQSKNSNLKSEVVYMFSKSQKNKEAIMRFFETKKLYHSEITLTFEGSTYGKELFYEGMLKATQRRLYELIQENMEIRQENKRLSAFFPPIIKKLLLRNK